MARAKVTTKGQVTIPAVVRKFLNVSPGDSVLFSPESDGSVNVRLAARPVSVQELAGSLRRDSQAPVDLDVARTEAREHRARRQQISDEDIE